MLAGGSRRLPAGAAQGLVDVAGMAGGRAALRIVGLEVLRGPALALSAQASHRQRAAAGLLGLFLGVRDVAVFDLEDLAGRVNVDERPVLAFLAATVGDDRRHLVLMAVALDDPLLVVAGHHAGAFVQDAHLGLLAAARAREPHEVAWLELLDVGGALHLAPAHDVAKRLTFRFGDVEGRLRAGCASLMVGDQLLADLRPGVPARNVQARLGVLEEPLGPVPLARLMRVVMHPADVLAAMQDAVALFGRHVRGGLLLLGRLGAVALERARGRGLDPLLTLLRR